MIPSINEMIPSINEMISSINEMIPSINEMIPSINEMIPSINISIIEILNKIKNVDVVKLFGYIYIIKFSILIISNSKQYCRKKIKLIPQINNYINSEKKKVILEIQENFKNEVKNLTLYNNIPNFGIKPEEIENNFKKMHLLKGKDYKNGKVSGATYSHNKELDLMLNNLFKYFNKSNPLHTNLFPAIRKMENECIKFMIELFNGDKNVCGIFTSGGTESILMACKTYRDIGYNNGIKNPEIIVSDTAHCSFNKACKYFNIKLISIPCLINGLFDIDILKKKINKNTILIVGSNPSYNLGIIDPIPELNDIALKNNIPLHLDACIGSFLINFSKYKYDFSYKGVSSISADFHKYGHTPKGASSILYRHKEIMKYQYYIDTKWSGGVYATNSISGSRCGNIIALSWATILYCGKVGYHNDYKKILELNRYLKKKIESINELYIIGNPELSIIAITSNIINTTTLCEYLEKEGWKMNIIQNPNGFHFCITSYHNKDIIDNLILSIKKIINEKNLYIKDNSLCIYRTMKKINDNEIIEDIVTDYLHCVNNVNFI